MIKRKGQDTLVKAWPEVLRWHPTARLLLVGDGPNKRAVERLALRRGVADSVIFTGSVPWDQVPAYTDAGDVFAMPCRTRLFGLEPEAFGIVFLEAQACGLRVLVADSGGALETIRTAARVIDPSCSTEVSHAIHDLLAQDASRASVKTDDWGNAVSRLWRQLVHD
jgi:phosphatidylinositol alpha-1,6-mannosyltransferase